MSDHIEPADNGASSPPRGLSRRNLVRYGLGVGVGVTALPAFLAACGGSKDGTDTPAAGVANAPKATMGPPTEGVLYKDGYVGPKATKKTPFGDGTQTFTVVVPQDTTVAGDWNKNWFTDTFAKKTGINVKFQSVVTTGTAGNDMTKVNAMISAGDLPDAFMGIPFTRDQISLYGQQGVFAPLDDLIETYGVEMKHMQEEYPDTKTLYKSADGKTYAYTGLNDCYHCHVGNMRTFVNKKMLAKVGGAIPTTTEEFRELLKMLKDGDPNGHGDTIPFAAGVDNAIDRFIMNAWTYNPGEPWLRVSDDDKVEFVPNTPEWREGLKYTKSLFDDGLLKPEVFTMTTEALQRLGNTPGHARLGVVRAWYWGSFVDITYETGARWRDYECFNALKGPDGVQLAAWDYYSPYTTAGVQITKACKNPELMLQWSDFLMELENTNDAYGGKKDTNWRWGKEGQVGINGEQALYSLDVWPAPVNTSWNQYAPMYRSNDFRLGQFADPKNPNFEKDLYGVSVPYEKYAQPQKNQLPPLIFEADAAASNADIATALSNHVKQSMAQFSIGKLDISDDGAWNDYTDKIKKMGIDQYLSNYQQAYDNRPKG